MYPFSPKLPSHPVCHITLSQLIFDKSEIAVQWRKKNLVKKLGKVKVLGNGEIKTALKITAHAFSASAKAAIEKAGGSVTILEKKAK